eukprot:15365658-Ditylum_brightwellii.AAC.1
MRLKLIPRESVSSDGRIGSRSSETSHPTSCTSGANDDDRSGNDLKREHKYAAYVREMVSGDGRIGSRSYQTSHSISHSSGTHAPQCTSHSGGGSKKKEDK